MLLHPSVTLKSSKNIQTLNNVKNTSARTKNYKRIKTTTVCIINPLPKLNLSMQSKKNVALSTMFFCNLMTYTITRDLKDVIFIVDCGAEYIPVMKTWINLPVSLMFMYFYNSLLKIFKDNYFKVYACTFFSISSIISVLGIVLYPIRTNPLISFDTNNILLNNWIASSFYTMSPIWGTIVVSLLFWSVANRYTDVKEAKKIYPIFGIIANIALVSAGTLMHITGSVFHNNWNTNVQVLIFINMCFNALHLYAAKYIFDNYEPIKTTIKKNKQLGKLSDIIKTPFIRNMILMISCYGMMISFFETTWKYYVKLHFVDPILYSKFMATLSGVKGISTMSMMAISSFILQRVSWKQIALVTPTTLFVMGSAFFFCIFTNQSLITVVFIGGFINVFVKASKYAFFDPCKEIAYIPMDREIQTKGKASVDILASPIGKSSGQLLQQYIIFTLGSIPNTTTHIGILYGICSLIWLRVIHNMDKVINSSNQE